MTSADDATQKEKEDLQQHKCMDPVQGKHTHVMSGFSKISTRCRHEGAILICLTAYALCTAAVEGTRKVLI